MGQLYGKVEIDDLSDNTYTLGSENRGYYLGLHDDEADSLTIYVDDPADIYKDRYVVGGEVRLWCDSSNPPTTKRFTGVIERVERRDVYGSRKLEIEAREKFWVKALGRLIADTFSGLKAGEIVRQLLSKYASSFTYMNVQDTDVTVQSIKFNYRPLKECLDRLAEIAGADWYCDPDGDVHFYPKETLDQSLKIDEGDVEPIPSTLKDLTPVKTVVLIQGGVSLTLDQSQETTSSYLSLHDKDVAVKLTPSRIKARYVEMYLEKVGSPGDDLSGELVEDSSNSPTGASVGNFRFTKQNVSSAAWYAALLQANIDTTKSYWLILYRKGDESNTYRWYHNNSGSDTHAEKTDGSWTVYSSNSYRPAFKFYAGGPVLAKAVDPVGVVNYGYREEIITREDILKTEDARRIAHQILEEKRRVRTEFQKLKIRGLSTLPETGKLVDLTLSSLNFDGKVLVEDVELSFRAGDEAVEEIILTVGEDPETLDQTLAAIEEKIEEEKRRSLEDADAALTLVELFSESFPLSAEVYIDRNLNTLAESFTTSDTRIADYQQASGSFLAGAGRAGYMDVRA